MSNLEKLFATEQSTYEKNIERLTERVAVLEYKISEMRSTLLELLEILKEQNNEK